MAHGYEFELIDDQTDDPVVTMIVRGPHGAFQTMSEVSEYEGGLLLDRLNIEGIDGTGANSLGPAEIRRVIDALMLELDIDEIIVKGTVRQSGAGPGRQPGEVRFRRRRSADKGND